MWIIYKEIWTIKVRKITWTDGHKVSICISLYFKSNIHDTSFCYYCCKSARCSQLELLLFLTFDTHACYYIYTAARCTCKLQATKNNMHKISWKPRSKLAWEGFPLPTMELLVQGQLLILMLATTYIPLQGAPAIKKEQHAQGVLLSWEGFISCYYLLTKN